MAVRDARFFRLIFGSGGAIERFYRNPDLAYTVVEKYYLPKKPVLKLIRFLLQRYRVYEEDNELVRQLYLNKTSDLFIRRLTNPQAPPVLADQTISQLEKINQLPVNQKEAAFVKLIPHLDQKPTPSAATPTTTNLVPTVVTRPSPQTNPSISETAAMKNDATVAANLVPVTQNLTRQILGGVNNFSVNLTAPTKKFIGRYLNAQNLTSVGFGVVGAAVGAGLAGPAGAAGGLVLGAAIPKTVTSGGGRIFLSAGAGAAEGGARFLTDLNKANLSSKVSNKALGLMVGTLFFVLPIIITLLGGFNSSTAEASPVNPTSPVSPANNPTNLTSCQLHRGGDPVPATQIANPLLVSKITEIADKVGVPPAIIAGIMRVETGQAITSISDYVSNDYDAHFSKDDAGNIVAIGVMQFTPGTFLGTFNNNKEQMQALFNKTDVSAKINPQNAVAPANILRIYSITDSIIAAAFKVKTDKNSINGNGPWDETTVRKVAERYYGVNKDGTTNYPGFDGSTQNYGNDLWDSYSKCRTLTAFSQIIPPYTSTDYQTLHDDIVTKFKIDFDRNFSYDYLKWGWEKLWNSSGTKFLSLINPNNEKIEIIRDNSGINEQIGCSKVRIRGKSVSTGSPYPETLFKYVFLHELSHIIENCYPNTANKATLEQIQSQESYLTTFAQNSNICPGSVGDIPLNEDFADTLSYYLNQDLPEQSLGIGSACEPQISTNPYAGGRKPLHQQFAQILLGTSNTPVAKAGNLATLSCPVVGGGRNRLPSYQADPINGHCGSNYNSKLTNPADQCTGNTRRGKSIDIETGGANGKDVVLPIINGQPVSWQYINNITLARSDCFEEEILNPDGIGGGCGTGYVFKTDLGGGKNWILHLLHMGTTNLQLGQTYPSGTLVGKTEAIHTHISVGQDIQNPLSQIEPGWLSVDTQVHLCE